MACGCRIDTATRQKQMQVREQSAEDRRVAQQELTKRQQQIASENQKRYHVADSTAKVNHCTG